jgi:ATP-dependent Clp protease ATP-binding subunit ClpA
LAICYPLWPGFSLVNRRWGLFDVSKIRDMDFNSDAFSSLMLAQDKKDLILALIDQHNSKDAGFDDLIKGKGRGLAFLLHGPPGVGKTFTAGIV